MRIRYFRPDNEQLPTSNWFMADEKYPVMYEMINSMTVRFHFYFNTIYHAGEIVDAANKVFCRQPKRCGHECWKVKRIEELNPEDQLEKIIQVEYCFG